MGREGAVWSNWRDLVRASFRARLLDWGFRVGRCRWRWVSGLCLWLRQPKRGHAKLAGDLVAASGPRSLAGIRPVPGGLRLRDDRQPRPRWRWLQGRRGDDFDAHGFARVR